MKAKQICFIIGRPKFKGCKYGLPQPLVVIFFEKENIGFSCFGKLNFIMS